MGLLDIKEYNSAQVKYSISGRFLAYYKLCNKWSKDGIHNGENNEK